MLGQEMLHVSRIVSVCQYTSTEEERGSTHSYPITAPHHGELIFFLSGGDTTVYDGITIQDRPNSVRYLPCYASRGTYKVTDIKPGSCIDIYFDTVEDMPHQAMGLGDQASLSDNFIKIYNLWREKRPGYYAQVLSVFYDIIFRLGKSVAYVPKEKRERLDAAYDYLRKNYTSHPFDYRALCACSGFSSYSYFSRRFQECYAMSPVQFVTKLRVDQAKELLATGRYSVTEVAAMCGFENVYYFSRVFKIQVGLSPKNYR